MSSVQSLEADVANLRIEMRKLIAPVQAQIDATDLTVSSLSTTVNTPQGAYAEIMNVINNSHPEWSKDAYENLAVLPDGAGDENLECSGWFRQLAADTALVPASATALKALKTTEPADHTLWAANEAVDADIPRWDKVSGPIALGGATNRWDIYTSIPNDITYPGQVFYLQFEAMLAGSTALPSGLQAFAGIWDNTPAIKNWVEGGSFTITDDQGNDPGVTFGTPGSSSVDYQLVAFTDGGEQAISNILNFPYAPATFNGSNHPRIRFSGVPGFIRFDVYRYKDGVYVKQFTVGNSVEGTYFDVGNPPLEVVSGFPVITATKPKAYAITRTLAPGTVTGIGWVRHALTIQVPTTYNRGATTAGSQYLRIGLSNVTTDAGQILIRRIGLSMGSGKWARSPNDARPDAHSSPSTTATGAGAGTGGGIDPPPGGGSGGCVLMSSVLSLANGTSEDLEKVPTGTMVDNGGPVNGMIAGWARKHASRIYWVTMESGLAIGCTFDHPFIADRNDFTGTPFEVFRRKFVAGEPTFMLTRPAGEVIFDRIVGIEERSGDFDVGVPLIDGPSIIILNGFMSHNLEQKGGDPFV